MKTLTALLASLALWSCGGLDESLVPEAASEVPPALESSQPSEPTMTKPIPTPVTRAELELTLNLLRMLQNPVEERFFYPVDLNAPPPGLPLPPCPMCR
ncbi:MAG: hypothetical protein Q8S33_13140 [Myxococcales bacterium]|nr:hypothetical protein [Myxococcales bacterium]